MRYFRIVFLDEAATPGFMVATDDGAYAGLRRADGSVLAEDARETWPHHSYRTLDHKDVAPPSWGAA